MSLLAVVLLSAVVLSVAYFTYGNFLRRRMHLDARTVTPAVQLQDDVDYAPLEASSLFPQHFSAIAAAGPIVGPILACITFGWAPALIWILVGSIFVGGVHDFLSLVASVKHKARSIAEVVRDHMSHRSYLLFLTFIWIALVYIIVAFTDITAASFIGPPDQDRGNVGGGAIATSSLLYLVLPILMALAMRYGKLSLQAATLIFVPLVGVAIWAGGWIPFDVQSIFGLSDIGARKTWDVALLVYCLVAGVLPAWLLLQPRGHLGGYFLYFALGFGALGLIFGGKGIEYPAFRGWEVATKNGPQTLFPVLFITIACGACSGFHSLIASGTTSKQLRKETDAQPIGYGAMLLEGMVAVVSLCCVMMLAPGSPELARDPNVIYARGIGSFMGVLHIPEQFAVSFALMAFTTFVYDTLDVCTRLGRYILVEISGAKGWIGRTVATAVTAGAPLFFLLRHPDDAQAPVWRIFWQLFGASNQLLAALTLLGVTIWLWRTRREAWVWLVAGLPTLFMYVMSSWALVQLTLPKFHAEGVFVWPGDPVPYVGLVLLALAGFMLVEALFILASLRGQPPRRSVVLPSPA